MKRRARDKLGISSGAGLCRGVHLGSGTSAISKNASVVGEAYSGDGIGIEGADGANRWTTRAMVRHSGHMNRAGDWLRQAEDDFLWAKDTLVSGRFAQACFVCQQCAEKALKALALARGFDRVKSHSILEIARALAINGDVEEAAKRLDLYYISARYPDALPSGAPFEFFTKSQATEAVELAERVLGRVRTEVRPQHG